MRWWSSKPQSVTAQTLDSAAFLLLHFYLALLTHNFLFLFLESFIPFLFPPVPIPYRLPSFTRRRRLSLSLHPLLPPQLARARSDRLPGRRPRLPVSTARLRFPPLLGIPKSSLCESVSAFPCPVAPHLPSSAFTIRSLLAPGLSRPGVPSSLCLPPPSACPPPPSAGLDRRLSTLPVLGGGVLFFVPTSPVLPPCPPRVPHRLLVSSED